eukprot:5458257-Karenia_brevis.AAC.1
MTSVKTDDRAKTMSMIIEGIRGDAAQIAIDVGPTKILGEKGLQDFTEAITQHAASFRGADVGGGNSKSSMTLSTCRPRSEAT